MPRVVFEPKIQVFKRAKTFRALDHAASVIGCNPFLSSPVQLLRHGTFIHLKAGRTSWRVEIF
jgi:hypothetical protein